MKVLDWMNPVREQVNALVAVALEDGLSGAERALRMSRVHAALDEFQAGPPREPQFPEPFVSKPRLEQVLRGARTEYEGKPGEVLTGWVESVREKDGGVFVTVNRPGSMMMMTFLAPHFVPVEKLVRVSCAPDPSPEQCWKCHQGEATTGTGLPCVVCHRPAILAQLPVEQRMVAAFEAGDITVPNGGGYEAKTEAGRTLLDSLTPEQLETGMGAYVVREGHRRIRMTPEQVIDISAAGHAAVRVEDDPRIHGMNKDGKVAEELGLAKSSRCPSWPEDATAHVCESCAPEEIAKLNREAKGEDEPQ